MGKVGQISKVSRQFLSNLHDFFTNLHHFSATIYAITWGGGGGGGIFCTKMREIGRGERRIVLVPRIVTCFVRESETLY